MKIVSKILAFVWEKAHHFPMKIRIIPTCFLALYSAVLIDVMVFKNIPVVRIGSLMLRFGGTETGYPPNFVPFKTILPYLLGEKGWIIAGINLVGNILVLVPVGFLFLFVYRDMRWKTALVLAIVTGLLIEGMQALFRVGIFDIDDVILNGLGVMIGYGVCMALLQWARGPSGQQ